MTLVSRAAFARMVGCKPPSITQALHEGRLHTSPGTDKIDIETQLPVWLESHSVDTDSSDGVVSLAEARRRRELATARKAESLADEVEGKLVRKDHVEASRFVMCRTIRDGVLSIPERVSASVAAEVMTLINKLYPDADASLLDHSEVTRIINRAWTHESREVLENIAKLGGHDKHVAEGEARLKAGEFS